jgi:hypothetical protein
MSNQAQVQEKVFADGFSFKRRDNAPDFVVGSISVKVDDAISFLKSNQRKGWVNIDIKTAKSGKPYMELDTWEPNQREEVTETKDDLPF